MTISYLVGEIIRGEKPITPSSSIFAQIYALGYPIGESELVAKLEGERERARVKFPEAFFCPGGGHRILLRSEKIFCES